MHVLVGITVMGFDSRIWKLWIFIPSQDKIYDSIPVGYMVSSVYGGSSLIQKHCTYGVCKEKLTHLCTSKTDHCWGPPLLSPHLCTCHISHLLLKHHKTTQAWWCRVSGRVWEAFWRFSRHYTGAVLQRWFCYSKELFDQLPATYKKKTENFLSISGHPLPHPLIGIMRS